jgi:hypothetical protein
LLRITICIPRSRHNPKILRVDDAEIVGDRITEVRPIPRNFFTQETERRIANWAQVSIEAFYPMLVLIHVFLDNARYHHAKIVRGSLSRGGE